MALIDGAACAGTSVSADVCIVGAGPAGVAVASVLARTGARVIVRESGGVYLDRPHRRNLFPALRDHAAGAQSATRGHHLANRLGEAT